MVHERTIWAPPFNLPSSQGQNAGAVQGTEALQPCLSHPVSQASVLSEGPSVLPFLGISRGRARHVTSSAHHPLWVPEALRSFLNKVPGRTPSKLGQ